MTDHSRLQVENQLGQLQQMPSQSLLRAVELGTGLVDGYARYESAVGEVIVAFNPAGISAVDLADAGFEERFDERFGRHLRPARPPSAWGRRIGRALEEGRPREIPVDFRSVTTFQKSVLEAAATIPRGEVRPYSWLAKEVGNPGSVRAVGSTMARNPVPLIIPCHRVVRADGILGKYSMGGPDTKRRLLEHEGAGPDQLEELAGRGVRLVASSATGLFCYPTCAVVRRTPVRSRTQFGSAADALAGGYQPCGACRPM
ncbi:MAG TPA: methylated-DNA--[protein]-cysteine S-methyltransferase [Acidimicrobiia bacterium]